MRKPSDETRNSPANGLSHEKELQEGAASGKRGGRCFGAHTLHLTKLFPVTYSALTFKKKIQTRRIHMSYSHTEFTRHIHMPYTDANPFIGRIREEFEQIERIRKETELRIHTPYTHAVHTRR